jgi:hypothetical protein
MVIGLVGRIGSGKGTISDVLVNKYGYIKMSFADPLKDATAAAFGWPRHLLEGDTDESRKFRETPCSFWSDKFGRDFTPREALQKTGTEAFRDTFINSFWTNALEQKINKLDHRKIVIPDTRFVNEIDSVRSLGGKIIYVHPPEPEAWLEHLIEYKNPNIVPDNMHSSEWDWALHNWPYNAKIENDKSLGLENFKEKIVSTYSTLYNI